MEEQILESPIFLIFPLIPTLTLNVGCSQEKLYICFIYPECRLTVVN